jgi:hypothetical protein
MTAAQANTAFQAHAASFPATHVRILAPIPAGVLTVAGTASELGITAPVRPAGAAVALAPSVNVNTPSSRPNLEYSKFLNSMAAHREKWSHTKSVAHDFISKLETALRQSPVAPVHWIYLLPLMVSENNRDMQDWIEAKITTPNVSWNAAKVAFMAHYERADWKDSLKEKYDLCRQGPNESVQKYTDRFSALMRHLNYEDTNVLNVANYMKGLHSDIFSKLFEHRSQVRTFGLAGAAANPNWDFSSFVYVSNQAASIENELNAANATRDTPRAKVTAPAVHNNNARAPQHKRKGSRGDKNGFKPNKRAPGALHCKWHPDAHSHATKDCRNPGTTIALSTRTTVSPRAPTSTTVAPAKDSSDLSKIQCYGCGKMGHYKPDCPNKSQWSTDAKSPKGKQGFKGNKVKARASSVSWDSSVTADN